MNPIISILQGLGKIEDTWRPHIVGTVNNHALKVARIEGEFVWHHHDESDEGFYVLKGEFTMQYREGEQHLAEGDFVCVPKGVEHRPVADQPCWILLFEKQGTINTGSVDSDLTAPSNIWMDLK